MVTKHFAFARCLVIAASAAVLVVALGSSPIRADITAEGTRGSAVEGSAFVGAVAYFRCTRPGSAETDFLATIDWVDGATSAGTIVSDGAGGYYVQGRHTFAEAGIYRLGIRIEDLVDGFVTTKMRQGVH